MDLFFYKPQGLLGMISTMQEQLEYQKSILIDNNKIIDNFNDNLHSNINRFTEPAQITSDAITSRLTNFNNVSKNHLSNNEDLRKLLIRDASSYIKIKK